MGTLDSAVGSGSLADSTSLNAEVRFSDASNAMVCTFVVECLQKICHSLSMLMLSVALSVSSIITIE